MRLGTLRAGGRDGTLVVVRRDGEAFARADEIAPTLQAALDRWDEARPRLEALARRLDGGAPAEPLRVADLHSPLPRAYEWIDGSAFLSHVRLARRSRGAEPPPNLTTDPLVYQGGSACCSGPPTPSRSARRTGGWIWRGRSPPSSATSRSAPAPPRPDRRCGSCAWSTTSPSATWSRRAGQELRLLPVEASHRFSPFAVTPNELGPAWRDGRVHLPLRVHWNGQLLGQCDAGEMHFSFFELVAHIARTRAFSAGTLLGSGTVSNEDQSRGVSCLVERRMIEQLEGGAPRTPYLQKGDRVRIEMLDGGGRNLFGSIDQEVT
jgi:fumarylacetoacetate (FAA) hydrolase